MGETGTGLHWRAAAQRPLRDDRSRARIDGELVRVLREKAAAEVTLLRLRDELVEVQRSVQRAAQKRHVVEQRQAEEAMSLERVRTTLEQLRAQQAKLESNVALLRKSRADATRTAALIDTGEIATGERRGAVTPPGTVRSALPAAGASSAETAPSIATGTAAAASPRIAPSRTAGAAHVPPAQDALRADAASTDVDRAAEPAKPETTDSAAMEPTATEPASTEPASMEPASMEPTAEATTGAAAPGAAAPESEADTEPVLAARAPAQSAPAPAIAAAAELAAPEPRAAAPAEAEPAEAEPAAPAPAEQRASAPEPASTDAATSTDAVASTDAAAGADGGAVQNGAAAAGAAEGDAPEDPHGPDHPARRRTGFVPVDAFDERTKKERKKADREARRYLQQEQREEKRRAKARKQQMRDAVKAKRSGSEKQPEKLDAATAATGEEPSGKRGWGAVDLMLAVLIIALLAAGFAIFAWPHLEDTVAGWTSAGLLATPLPLRRSAAGPPARSRDRNQITIAAERPAPTRKTPTP